MSPSDFNAMCEGYENKKHAAHELIRQQTYILVSPYIDKKKGAGYDSFKRKWRFWWEENDIPDFKPMTKEETDAIIERHSKYKKAKK